MFNYMIMHDTNIWMNEEGQNPLIDPAVIMLCPNKVQSSKNLIWSVVHLPGIYKQYYIYMYNRTKQILFPKASWFYSCFWRGARISIPRVEQIRWISPNFIPTQFLLCAVSLSHACLVNSLISSPHTNVDTGHTIYSDWMKGLIKEEMHMGRKVIFLPSSSQAHHGRSSSIGC